MSGNGWSLEVVRGQAAGRVYALGRGETVLGNAPGGGAGVDLGPHEGASPRRMAAQQAQLDLSPEGLTVRDLDSPGGTFVNRQRLLPNQFRTLQPGDLVQLGGVQLKVVSEAAAVAAAAAAAVAVAAPQRAASPAPSVPSSAAPMPAARDRSGPPAAVFTLATGARCRSWDDFLTVSAQRWSAMRDELVSGRLATYMASIGRAELAPRASGPGTPDERLDAWLGALPTTRPSLPELDVHPASLSLRAAPGGGVLRSGVRITNTGYRLLRTTVRVEPASAGWIKIPAEFARGPFVTVDQTELAIEVHVPESFDVPPKARLVLASNGGTREVEVRLVRPATAGTIPDEPAAPHGQLGGLDLRGLIARQSIAMRLMTWSLAGLLLRGLVVLAGLVVVAGAGQERPPLRGAAVLLGVLGSLAAAGFALRQGEPRDVPSAGFAGGLSGVLMAAVLVAACRTVEGALGSRLAASPAALCLLWAIIGAALAGISLLAVPAQTAEEASS